MAPEDKTEEENNGPRQIVGAMIIGLCVPIILKRKKPRQVGALNVPEAGLEPARPEGHKILSLVT